MFEEILKVNKVCFSYGDNVVLEDINLSVYSNDLIALIGPNGGGKTTLLKIILGLLKPVSGSISLFNGIPQKMRYNIGYLPQKTNFDYNFPINVFDLVIMGRYSHFACNYSRDDYDSAENALKVVGMNDFKNRHISTLSGGQLQKVLIARALVKNPGLLLLDEPMSGVDTHSQSSFYELITKLHKKTAIIFVTHDISAVSAYFDKVICLNKKLYYHGPKEGSLGKLEEAYSCPVEVIAHGIPHRVLKEH